MVEPVEVIGGGLAGCEAAWQLARRGVRVRLHEMRPVRFSPAHTSATLAELVCSNSLRSDQLGNAVGLLHEEMRRLDSLVLQDILTGLVKAFSFGLIVGLVSCHQGLGTRGGAEEVGRATTKSVVRSIVLIIATDLFVTAIFFARG